VALPDSPQQQLDWEARQRPRAAIAALLAAVLVFGGQLFRGAAFADAPRGELLDALDRLQAPGPVARQPSVQVEAAQYLDDRTMSVLLPSIIEGIGYFALAYALTFLAAATRARRPQFPRIALYLPAVGGVLMGVVAIAGAVGRVIDVSDFLDGPRTVTAADDIGFGTFSIAAQVLYLPAALTFAAAYVLVCLNAMRAGLLTRFMGILGVIVGTLVIIQLGPFPVVQTFWLGGLALLLVGRRPGGDPPAWRTGREEPWPSQREMAEERRRQAETKRAETETEQPEPEAAPEPEQVGAAQHPASKKRRKRRR
jgi:hypothetical protein